MKRILQTSLFCACAAWAQPAQVVVPNGLADVEGNSSSADLFRTVSTDFQQVYDVSAFPLVPMIRIDSLGLVTQFQMTLIPEPSTYVMALAGTLLFALRYQVSGRPELTSWRIGVLKKT